MKKRYGYSLAETMVALSIVGVIALLVMPIIKSKMQDISNLSKLQKVYNSLTDAVGSWMVDDRISEIRKTSYISAYPERFMPKYLRTMQESNTSTEGLLGKVYTDRNSHQFRIDFQDKYDCALLQNGSTLCLTPYNDDKYITRYGASDGEQIVKKTRITQVYCGETCVEWGYKTGTGRYNKPMCPLKGVDINSIVESNGAMDVNAYLDNLKCTTQNNYYDCVHDNKLNGSAYGFRQYLCQNSVGYFESGLVTVMTQDSFFLDLFRDINNGDEQAKKLLDIPEFNQIYLSWKSDPNAVIAKNGDKPSKYLTHMDDAYMHHIVDAFGGLPCDEYSLPNNSNNYFMMRLYSNDIFLDYYKERTNNIKNNLENIDKNLLNQMNKWESKTYRPVSDTVFSDDGKVVNLSMDDCCGLYNAVHPGGECPTHSAERIGETIDCLSKKALYCDKQETFDETVPAEPTYTAPSESGKVNISQEQVHAHSSDKPIMEVVVDTNGASKPNKLGTDLFIFYIYPDGHVGVRSQDTSTNNCYMNQYYQCFKAVFNNDWKKPY